MSLPRHDSEVAAELGYGIRFFRRILDATPGSHLLKGRERYLLPRHVEVAIKALENAPCRSASTRPAKEASQRISRAEPSREDVWRKALELATGRQQSGVSRRPTARRLTAPSIAIGRQHDPHLSAFNESFVPGASASLAVHPPPPTAIAEE